MIRYMPEPADKSLSAVRTPLCVSSDKSPTDIDPVTGS